MKKVRNLLLVLLAAVLCLLLLTGCGEKDVTRPSVFPFRWFWKR